jgi:hypothetical protein
MQRLACSLCNDTARDWLRTLDEAVNRGGLTRRKAMEWFSRKTSIAGVQVPNWGIALGAIIVILLIYSTMH